MLSSVNVPFQTSGFSVAILRGRLVVTSDPGGAPLALESTVNTYNDGNWHYVSIMKMGAKYVGLVQKMIIIILFFMCELAMCGSALCVLS